MAAEKVLSQMVNDNDSLKARTPYKVDPRKYFPSKGKVPSEAKD
jgi:hypothetical protein